MCSAVNKIIILNINFTSASSALNAHYFHLYLVMFFHSRLRCKQCWCLVNNNCMYNKYTRYYVNDIIFLVCCFIKTLIPLVNRIKTVFSPFDAIFLNESLASKELRDMNLKLILVFKLLRINVIRRNTLCGVENRSFDGH